MSCLSLQEFGNSRKATLDVTDRIGEDATSEQGSPCLFVIPCGEMSRSQALLLGSLACW